MFSPFTGLGRIFYRLAAASQEQPCERFYFLRGAAAVVPLPTKVLSAMGATLVNLQSEPLVHLVEGSL